MKNQVNKKVSRLLITLLALVIMCVACVALTACDKECTHSNIKASADTATCQAGGFITYTCPDCRYSYMTATSKTEHEFGEGVIVAATCTEGGYTAYSCKNCGFTEKRAATEATGHTEEATTSPATCVKDGLKVVKCTVCNVVLGNEVIPATGHDYRVDKTVAATCGAAGYTVKKCSVCEEVITVAGDAATGNHTYVTDSEVAPTCSSFGYKVQVCSVCGNEHTVVLEKVAHAYGEATTVAATCTVKAHKEHACSFCGEVVSYDFTGAVAAHAYAVEAEIAATCGKDGTKIEKCTACGDVKTTLTVATGEHNYDAANAEVVAPTCTVAGYKLLTCSVCGNTVKNAGEAATGHDFTEVVSTVAPTCTTAGQQIVKCAHCDSTKVVANGDALGHDFVDGEVIAATCTNEGYTLKNCSVCQAQIRTDVVARAEHQLSEIRTVAATCTTEGQTVRECAVCKAQFVEYKAAAGHTWGVEPTIIAPTCVAPEYRFNTCTVCGETSEKTAFGEALNPEGVHEWEQEVVAAATCISTGKAVNTCAVCGAIEEVVLPLTKHSYALGEGFGKPVLAVTATCINDGYEIYSCDYCEARYTKGTQKALGHNFTEITVEATCNYGGYKVEKCTRCNCELGARSEITDQLPHSMVLTAEAEITDTLTKTLYAKYEDGKLAIYSDETCKEPFTGLCNVFKMNGDDKFVFVCDYCANHVGETFTPDDSTRTFDHVEPIGNIYNTVPVEITATELASVDHIIDTAFDPDESEVATCGNVGTLVYYCTVCAKEDNKFNLTTDYKTVEADNNIYHEIPGECTTAGLDYVGGQFVAGGEYNKSSAAGCTEDATYAYTCKRCLKTLEAGDKVTKVSAKGTNIEVVYKEALGENTDENEFIEYTVAMSSSKKLGHNWDTENGATYVVLNDKFAVRTCDDTKVVVVIKCSRCAAYKNTMDDAINTKVEVLNAATETIELVNTYNNVPKHAVYDAAVLAESGAVVWTNIFYYAYDEDGKWVVDANAETANVVSVVLNPAYIPSDADTKKEACQEFVCDSCGVTIAEAHYGDITQKAVTCKKAQECFFCGIEMTAKSHVAPAITCVPNKAGDDTHYYCEVCKNDPDAMMLGALTAHDFAIENETVAATCTAEGYTTYKCACGTVSEEKKDVKAMLPHVVTVLTTAATCTVDGNYALTCSACKQPITEGNIAVDDALKATAFYTANKIAIDAAAKDGAVALDESWLTITQLGHDMVDTVVAPTCVDAGYTTHECSRCDYTTENTDAVVAKGHTYGEFTTTLEATCVNAGSKFQTCSVCAEGTEGHVNTVVIDALGHTITVNVDESKKNCLYGNSVTADTFKCENGCGISAEDAADYAVEGVLFQAKVREYLVNKGVTVDGALDATLTFTAVEHQYTTFDTNPGNGKEFVAPTADAKGGAFWICSSCGARTYRENSVSVEDYQNPDKNLDWAKCEDAHKFTVTITLNGDPTEYTYNVDTTVEIAVLDLEWNAEKGAYVLTADQVETLATAYLAVDVTADKSAVATQLQSYAFKTTQTLNVVVTATII